MKVPETKEELLELERMWDNALFIYHQSDDAEEYSKAEKLLDTYETLFNDSKVYLLNGEVEYKELDYDL